MIRKAKFPTSGVFLAPPDAHALREKAAARTGIAWFDLNLERVAGKREFLAACAKTLRFPNAFGRNWDALADYLKDLCADSVINCRNCENLAAAAPDDYATAIEIFRDAASYWNERGSVFTVLVDHAPAGIALGQLG